MRERMKNSTMCRREDGLSSVREGMKNGTVCRREDGLSQCARENKEWPSAQERIEKVQVNGREERISTVSQFLISRKKFRMTRLQERRENVLECGNNGFPSVREGI